MKSKKPDYANMLFRGAIKFLGVCVILTIICVTILYINKFNSPETKFNKCENANIICVSEFAINTNNLTKCESELSDARDKTICYALFSQKTKNLLCYDLKDNREELVCTMIYATLHNLPFCNTKGKTESFSNEDLCNGVAVRVGELSENVTFCNKLNETESDKKYLSYCYAQYAIADTNLSICNLLDENNKNICIDEYSKEI